MAKECLWSYMSLKVHDKSKILSDGIVTLRKDVANVLHLIMFPVPISVYVVPYLLSGFYFFGRHGSTTVI